MATPKFTAGRTILLIGNIFCVVGSYVADYNETHVFNPTWPPHAKFHNGQTMSLSVCLAVASIYFAFRPCMPHNTISPKESAFAAAVLGSFYCFAGLTAILYPGTKWCDPEYPNNGEQKYVFSAIVALMWVAYFLEARRIEGRKVKAT